MSLRTKIILLFGGLAVVPLLALAALSYSYAEGLGREYWLFVLGLSISTALGFSFLLGRFTKSLPELTRAAEEDGPGETDPRLPVPTSPDRGQDLVSSRDPSPLRGVSEEPSGGELPKKPTAPTHLMTPEGLEAVLALAPLDPEDLN